MCSEVKCVAERLGELFQGTITGVQFLSCLTIAYYSYVVLIRIYWSRNIEHRTSLCSKSHGLGFPIYQPKQLRVPVPFSLERIKNHNFLLDSLPTLLASLARLFLNIRDSSVILVVSQWECSLTLHGNLPWLPWF